MDGMNFVEHTKWVEEEEI